MKAEVLTKWGFDVDLGNIAQIALDYPVTQTNVTYQDNIPPNPNIFVVVIECNEATMNQIIADPEYKVLPSGNEPVTTKDYDGVKSYLMSKTIEPNVDLAIGKTVNGRTKAEFNNQLRGWLKVIAASPAEYLIYLEARL